LKPIDFLKTTAWEKIVIQITGFGVFGVVSMFLNLAVTITLHEIFLIAANKAYPFGLGTAILVNFYLCRNVLFKSKGDPGRQLAIFVASSLFFRGLEYSVFLIQEVTINLPYILAILLIQGTSFLIKFWYYKRFVFTYKKVENLR